MNIAHYDILSAATETSHAAFDSPTTVTWLARDRELHSPVFLRVLRPECREDPAARALFMKQARTLALLRHAGVPAVYQLGARESECFCAHEPVEGTNLQDAIAQGVLAPEEALDIAGQIARVLEAADHRGLVYSGWGPQDVVRESRGTVKLASFELVTTEEAVSPREIPGETLPGRREFASPERLRGGPLDARSSFYTLGAILWFVLKGKQPLGEPSSVAALEQISSLPPAIVDLVRSLLQRDPHRRPATPAALAHAIRSARVAISERPELSPAGVETLFAPGPAVVLPTFTAAREPVQRHPRRTAFVEFVVGTLVAVFLFIVLSRRVSDVPPAGGAGLKPIPTLATPVMPSP